MKKERRNGEPAELLGGTLNVLGLKFDLSELLASSEDLKSRLEELRENLKAAGGKEGSGEEGRRGGISVTGYVRTRGILGDREFHLGATGEPARAGKTAPKPSEPMEPPVDVFDEGQYFTIVADVPGVSLAELDLRVEGRAFCLSTKASARRSYRKELHLKDDVEPDSMRSTCRNGVLEVHLQKKAQPTERP